VARTGRLRAALRSVESCWWADVFDLVYLRTGLAVHGPAAARADAGTTAHREAEAEAAALRLYLDYRIYRAQRATGARNAALLRALLRRSAAAAAAPRVAPAPATTSTLAATLPLARTLAVRYFLLTDHALDQFGGRMAALPQCDHDLAAAIRAAVSRLGEAADDSPLVALARAHFHLFYPPELGADARAGERLIGEALGRDPAFEEAYVHLAAHHARRGERAAVATCLDRYRRNAPDRIGPNLLARMLDEKQGDET
jgi:hypothetical protein